MASIVPSPRYPVPELNHDKLVPYTDFPVVYNATVTAEPFYVEYDFTICTSTLANTTLLKWNGNSWETISGWVNPDVIGSRGFHAITTSANEYVVITEHVNPS